MNLGCFHQDCIEKLKGKHVPTQTCKNRRDRKSVDCGACMYGTVMRKCRAWDGTGDEDRNMSGMRIKARRGLTIIWGM